MRHHFQETHSLNLNVRGLPKSPTIAINELSNELIAKGKVIYKLGLGQSPFPIPQPVVEALKANAHQKDYLPVQGLPELRDAVARFHRRNDNIPSESENVLVGPGSKELMFLLQVAYYGDLIVPTPCWVSYTPQAHILGKQTHFLPTCFQEKWRLLPDQLEAFCAADPGRPMLVVLNYPGNPDGATYSPTTLKRLAAVARKYQIILLSDEIYGNLHHQGKHVSIAQFYPEGTIVSSGLSKWCGAGGWRLGTFTFPHNLRWLLDAMASLASETFTSTSAPVQYAAVRAFNMGYEIEQYLLHVRRILVALGKWCTAKLRAAGVRVVEPEGGFYLFPDFTPLADKLARHGIATSGSLCARLLEDIGVAILPGSVFGRPESELTARISYVDFDGSRALAASESLTLGEAIDEAFLVSFCHRTVTAIKHLSDWLNGLEKS